ncbi:hypothetical protein MTQ10_29020 [Streptomyces sp. XM83C]|jgi:hypothetical protein|uniref:Uncharacterized protein n=1 Tax=Streptomyces thermocoprophilus TaxID=78356 RepID=A0ABV5VCN0_9ACTN|nr:hypothetical protein [Streptomyces sp. XM83C]MCK1823520.1 hypothetical protein [Streptomyces sp. XM83C]
MSHPTPRTDDDILAATDVGVLLRHGLRQEAFRPALFGDGAIAAAVTLDRLGVQPRSVAFVAKTARAGGLAYAAALTEPLPSPQASDVLRDWLESAAQSASGPEAERLGVRWLLTVAEIMGLRVGSRAPERNP